MTFGESLWSAVIVQSIGVAGLLLGRKQTAQQPPVPTNTGTSTPEPTLTAREQLREQLHLRPLSPEEEGFALRHLPEGIYGFTNAPLSEAPLFRTPMFRCFEVHKLAGGQAHLAAFADPDTARFIRGGQPTLETRLYPDPSESATELVHIPFDRLSTKKILTSRESGNWLEVTVLPSE